LKVAEKGRANSNEITATNPIQNQSELRFLANAVLDVARLKSILVSNLRSDLLHILKLDANKESWGGNHVLGSEILSITVPIGMHVASLNTTEHGC